MKRHSHVKSVVLLLLSGVVEVSPATVFAAPPRIIAVSYFDNTSGSERLRPLSKGFADMFVTELSKVRGIVIVERARLEELLKEIKLGESKFIDASTAQHLGKGLGADAILTGSYMVFQDTLRIDARLVEVATGKILLAETVSGKSSACLTLHARLTQSLTRSLKVDYTTEKSSLYKAAKSADLAAVTSYSRAIDLQDQDRGDEAEVILQQTVKDYPQFTIAKTKLEEVRQFMKDFERRQEETRRAELRKAAKEASISIDALDPASSDYEDQIYKIWDLLFKAKKMSDLLYFNASISKTCPPSLRERYLYYTMNAARAMKAYDLQLEAAKAYMTELPQHPLIAIVKMVAEEALEELERVERGKVGLEEKLAKVRKEGKTGAQFQNELARVYAANFQNKEAYDIRRKLLEQFDLTPKEEEYQLREIFHDSISLGRYADARKWATMMRQKYPASPNLKNMESVVADLPE